MNARPNWHVTFCIMTCGRISYLKNCLSSIREYCQIGYSIKILSQGPATEELIELISELDDDIELIISPVNLGVGGGRQLLSEKVTSSLIMMMDDDLYLTEGSIALALKAFEHDHRIGAVSMPLYDLHGHMVAAGGAYWIIRNGVLSTRQVELDCCPELVEVERVSAGAMLYRTEMKQSFSWDPEMHELEDEDKSLQILRDGKWKQVIVAKGRLIHDRSWLGKMPSYERQRFDGLRHRRSYRIFRRKWGLRFDLRSHILWELLYPALGLIPSRRPISFLDGFIRIRMAREQSARDGKCICDVSQNIVEL